MDIHAQITTYTISSKDSSSFEVHRDGHRGSDETGLWNVVLSPGEKLILPLGIELINLWNHPVVIHRVDRYGKDILVTLHFLSLEKSRKIATDQIYALKGPHGDFLACEFVPIEPELKKSLKAAKMAFDS